MTPTPARARRPERGTPGKEKTMPDADWEEARSRLFAWLRDFSAGKCPQFVGDVQAVLNALAEARAEAERLKREGEVLARAVLDIQEEYSALESERNQLRRLVEGKP